MSSKSDAKKTEVEAVEAEIMSGFHKRLLKLLNSERESYLEKALGVSRTTISGRWKEGGYPNTEKVIRICKHFDVSPTWLLLGKHEKSDIEEKYLVLKTISEDIEGVDIYVDMLSTAVLANDNQMIIMAMERILQMVRDRGQKHYPMFSISDKKKVVNGPE